MKQKKNRVGQIIKNKNGQEMTIITYRHCRNIDVVFEDGTVVNHQRMEDFIAGKIVNPNYKIAYDISMNEFIAQYYFQHIGFDKYECGTLQEYGLENYSLDLFNPTMKIGIEYDGNIHQHHTNRDETKDNLCAQNNIYLIRIRERLPQTKNAQCYHLATPTHFSSRYEDILKEIANHLHQKFDIDLIDINFKKDKQLILDTYAKKHVMPHIGEEYVSRRGEHAKIIQYFSSQEVVVEFDDGFRKQYSMYALRRGNFCRYDWAHYLAERNAVKIGECKQMTNGMQATLIAYRNHKDCDFIFEDGTVVTNKEYADFTSLILNNPNIDIRNQRAMHKHVNETAIMKNGQRATIVEYRTYKDIDVKMEDGTILTHQRYDRFKLGQITTLEQKLPPINFNSREGEKKRMNCGQMATIIAYRNSQDIDIQFEDGVIAYKKLYSNFKKGAIAHPSQLRTRTRTKEKNHARNN